MELLCPIRGKVKVNIGPQTDIKSSEEYQRINLVKFLLKKGYSKDEITFEIPYKFGNSGRNSIRPDIVIYREDRAYLVAEVKADNKNKEDAINNQLIPAMKLFGSTYGIYYDGVQNAWLNNEFKEFPWSVFPDASGNSIVKFKYENLEKIGNSVKLFELLDQNVHSSGVSIGKRYLGILQLLMAKYFDEKHNRLNLNFFNSDVDNTIIRIQNLYDNAYKYYNRELIDLGEKLILNKECIFKIVEILQGISFLKSDLDVLQQFFMFFSPKLLNVELAQYYTPLTIVKFISNIVMLGSTSKAIDPAGGSGDFLVGLLNKYRDADSIRDNIFYWDISKDAASIAYLNLMINGDGKSNIEILDSIANFEKKNNEFDFVITNPPFGKKTTFNGTYEERKRYSLSKLHDLKSSSIAISTSQKSNDQLGVLFVERSINLLKEDGILAIVLPSSYLDTINETRTREYIFSKGRVIAVISLPANTFKGANTGVKTSILLFKKTAQIGDYEILTCNAKEIGFDYTKKQLPQKYRRDSNTGDIITDKNNDPILDNDLDRIEKEIKYFAYVNAISGIEQSEIKVEYDFILFSNLDENFSIKPYLNTKGAMQSLSNSSSEKKTSLAELKNKGFEIEIDSLKKLDKEYFKPGGDYNYFTLASLYNGVTFAPETLKGWEISNISRARKKWIPNSFAIPYLLGSSSAYGFNPSFKNEAIITTGAFVVFIKDDIIKISFFNFLNSKDYKIQCEAFSTGAIQVNLKDKDVMNFKFPILSGAKLDEATELFNEVNSLSKKFVDQEGV